MMRGGAWRQVADAMLLRQLFEGLFDRGVRVCFTSNRPPEQLYERGLNRAYFLPFVRLLRERCAVMRVGDEAAAVDYRALPPPTALAAGTVLPMESHLALAPRPRGAYFHGASAEARLRERWSQQVEASSSGGTLEAATLSVAFGRTLAVRARAGDACWFTFDELCGRRPGVDALGASDFLALAEHTRSLYLSGVPILSMSRRNDARRFVVLIDALYEARVRLVLAAEAPLERLVAPLLEASAGDGLAEAAEVEVGRDEAPRERERAPSFSEAPVAGSYRVDGELAAFFTAKDEAFMLRRTISRLTEMTAAS